MSTSPLHVTLRASLAALLGAGAGLGAVAWAGGDRSEPPPAPPPVTDVAEGAVVFDGGKRAATTEWSHGDPSDDEQWFLELMNRARLDPAGEADRILDDYGSPRVTEAVDFFLSQRPGVEYTRRENHDAFEAIDPAPPLAFHPALIQAARGHTAVMRQVDEQTHQAVGEPTLGQRVTASGYERSRLGESIFCFADHMLHAHAGFAVDWGQPLGGGGRPETGHRDSLMDPEFVDVGVGVLYDSSKRTKVGPELITIDFAVPLDSQVCYVTGVVYEDVNGNDVYDPGEGIPGVRVETDVSDFFAISSSSGGYAVPVPPGSGTTTVFATGEPGTPGEPVGEQQVVVEVGADSVKVDFGPPPPPPVPDVAELDDPVGGAFGDGATLDRTITVPRLDPEVATVGVVEVAVAIDHDDIGELTVSLVGPTGTTARLLAPGASGADLRTSFDSASTPLDPLSVFAGTPYEGTWTLRVQDAAGGAAGGVVESWRLSVQPSWIRPLDAVTSRMTVKSMKLKDSPKAGKDKLVLKADVAAGAEPLDVSTGGVLRLADPDTGATYLELDVLAPGAKRATPAGAKVKAKIKVDDETGKGSVTLKASRLDLAAPPPDALRAELWFGGDVLAERIDVTSGKSKGGSGAVFLVDKLSSEEARGGGRSTSVKGRLRPVPGGEVGPNGRFEVRVGTAVAELDADDVTAKGSKLTFKSKSGLRKLVVDTRKGKFSLKFDGPHDVLEDGTTTVTLRLGGLLYATQTIRPRIVGKKTIY